MTEKKKILFVCNHNAGRSKMAAAILNARYGDRYEGFSAGVDPAASVNETTIAVLKEIGIDISDEKTRNVKDYRDEFFDVAVITCSCSDDVKKSINAKFVIDQRFADPYLFSGPKEEVTAGFRKVRDAISDWVDGQFGIMKF